MEILLIMYDHQVKTGNSILSNKPEENTRSPRVICVISEPCALCFAQLVIYSGELTPKYIAGLFDLGSDFQITEQTGALAMGKFCCSLSSRGHIHSNVLSEHIGWILNRVETNGIAAFEKLSSHPTVKMKMHCTWFSRNESWLGDGLTIPAEQMALLASYNLELAFNVFFNFFE